jgi:NAD(P)-dependent dehydrogenase (short-subunit alcohol dehydrogenase family)
VSIERLPARFAIVSGSSAGIGRAIVLALLADGWRVTGIDRVPSAIDHPAYVHREGDLAGAAPELVLEEDDFRADALIHAAGLMHAAPLGELHPDVGDRLWRVHVRALERLANRLLPAMAQRRSGRLIVIGSRVSSGLPGRSQYAASKSALIGMVRSWASELAPAGVTANIVSPAATRTAMLDDPRRASSAPRMPPIGRLIEADEIAALVRFLLSIEAAAITGQDIAVCGGASLPV